MKQPLSVLIPVKNEATNLPRCLRALAWAEEIFVVDSQSTDGTQRVAEEHGSKLVQFSYQGGWPKKKNWALQSLAFRHEWVLIVDADEVFPAGTEQEIGDIVSGRANAGNVVGYWINRRFMFMGRWLKHAYYPNWNLRLFKHALGRYEKLTGSETGSGDNEVHEHVVVTGQTGYLRAQMDHYAFPTIDIFIEKHNRYSNWEARVALEAGLAGSAAQLQASHVSTRRLVKALVRRLPLRPLLRFLYVYVWQKGFLDGVEGYYFARLHAVYELLCVAKTAELKLKIPPNHSLA